MCRYRNDRLRVLLLAPTKITGGITTWARSLLRHSDEKKVDYEVIDTSRSVPLGSKLNLYAILRRLYDAAKLTCEILKSLRRKKADIVYFTCAPSLGLVFRDAPCMLLMHALRVPFLAHLHGGNVQGFLGRGWISRSLLRAAFRRARAVIVITREVERAATAVLGADKVIYMPNMIDDELLARQKEKRIQEIEPGRMMTLIHVAWQSPKKGSLDLVEAMPFVRTPVYCRLIGRADGENRTLIENRIESLGVPNRIGLVGLKKGAEIQREFEEADLFVLPTHRRGPEGFPLAVLEAMAYGVPIVANEVGNIREMIGADTEQPAGVLLEQVEPVDPRELAEKIDALLADPDQRRRMSENGRRRIREHYRATRVVPRLEATIARLAERAEPSRGGSAPGV